MSSMDGRGVSEEDVPAAADRLATREPEGKGTLEERGGDARGREPSSVWRETKAIAVAARTRWTSALSSIITVNQAVQAAQQRWTEA